MDGLVELLLLVYKDCMIEVIRIIEEIIIYDCD